MWKGVKQWNQGGESHDHGFQPLSALLWCNQQWSELRLALWRTKSVSPMLTPVSCLRDTMPTCHKGWGWTCHSLPTALAWSLSKLANLRVTLREAASLWSNTRVSWYLTQIDPAGWPQADSFPDTLRYSVLHFSYTLSQILGVKINLTFMKTDSKLPCRI